MKDHLNVELLSRYCKRASTALIEDANSDLILIAKEMGLTASMEGKSKEIRQANDYIHQKSWDRAAALLFDILNNAPNNASAWVNWSRTMLALWLTNKSQPYLDSAKAGINHALLLNKNNEAALMLKTAIESAKDKPGRKSLIVAFLILISLFALIGSLGWIFHEMTTRPAQPTPQNQAKHLEEVKHIQKSLNITLAKDEMSPWALKQASANIQLSYNSQQKNTSLDIRASLINRGEKECSNLRLVFKLMTENGDTIDRLETIALGPKQATVLPGSHVPIGFQTHSTNPLYQSIDTVELTIKRSTCKKLNQQSPFKPLSVDLLPIKPNGIDFSFFQKPVDVSVDKHLGLHHYESIIQCRNTGLKPIKLVAFKIQYIDRDGSPIQTSKEMTIVDPNHPPLNENESRYIRVKRPFSSEPIQHAKIIISRLE